MFVLEFMVSTFKIATPIAKHSFRTASVLFPTMITSYKIYSVFGIAIKRFVDAINFVYMYVCIIYIYNTYILYIYIIHTHTHIYIYIYI